MVRTVSVHRVHPRACTLGFSQELQRDTNTLRYHELSILSSLYTLSMLRR